MTSSPPLAVCPSRAVRWPLMHTAMTSATQSVSSLVESIGLCPMLAASPLPCSVRVGGDRVRRAASARAAAADQAWPGYTHLVEWCRARGAEVHPALTCRESRESGRGLAACQDVAAGTLLARLPFSCCVYSPETPSDEWTASRQLAAALLVFAEEPGNAPVVATWPRDACAGALAPQVVLDALQYTPLAVEADRIRRRLCADDDSPPLSWALSLVATRRCHVLCVEQPPGRGGSGTSVIVPLFDLANHSPAPELDFKGADGCLELRCRKSVLAGDQLTICYGPGDGSAHSSDHLFLTYGMHDAEADDSVMLWRSDWHLLAWLMALTGSSEQAADERLSNGGAGWDSLASWDATPFDRREWLCLTSREDADEGQELEVDARFQARLEALGCQERAAELLQLRAAQLLAGFPTTCEEDDALLAASSFTGLRETAIRIRAAKKRLLKHLLELV